MIEAISMFLWVAIVIVALVAWVSYIVAPVVWVMHKTTNPFAVFGMFLFTASSGVTGLLQFIQWIK